MGGFNASKVDEEIASLLKKFDQLYDAGVRQFGVLGDDVGSLDPVSYTHLMCIRDSYCFRIIITTKNIAAGH